MNRYRLAALAMIFGLALLSGCCNVGHGEILARLGFGPRCPCETCGSAPVCYEGPELCDGCGGAALNGGGGGPMLAPPPTRIPPLAQPDAAGPVSRSH